MGGSIGVESEPDRGSSFHLSIPFEKPSAPGCAESVPGRGLESEQMARMNIRLLLAEDNPTNQKVAKLMLEKYGYDVHSVANGREALEAMARADYDLVLMDVQMPEMDGIEATVKIREQERVAGRSIPIVAMTAHAMAGDRDRCLAAGMDEYVAKPVDYSELVAIIERLIRSRNGEKKLDALPVDPRIFDRGTLLQRLDGDTDLFREVLGVFLSDCPGRLAKLGEALNGNSLAEAERHAHSLKGAAATIAAPMLRQTAYSLEVCCRNGCAGEARDLYVSLCEDMERLVKQVDVENGVWS
jgi:CheY-like chemotaxis protein/HPt (histidine-containing phosphotransfer) domain-containing protein